MLLMFIGSMMIVLSLFINPFDWWMLIVGIVLFLIGKIASDDADERAKARANQQRYWAHYYDEDQVRARQRRQEGYGK